MQEPTLLYALRHGQTAWNAEQRIQGQLDVPLNEAGRWQAARLALALADAGIAAVYASDLERARATAEPLALAAGAPLRLDARLRERGFGIFEGHTYADIESRWPAEAARWRRRVAGPGPEGGEALEAFHARSVQAVCEIAAAHAGQTIAIVAHGGVLDCLYRAAVGVALDAPRTWQLGNASINRLLFNGERLALVGWSDEAHLEGDPLA